jgi:hypothetical protein
VRAFTHPHEVQRAREIVEREHVPFAPRPKTE